MKKQKLYIETSVFGFYYDEDERNLDKRVATVKLFEQIKMGLFEGYISDIVLRELIATSDIELREKLYELAEPLEVLKIYDDQEIEFLTDLYLRTGIMLPNKRNDALHISMVVVNPQIDVLVSWNCSHIVNTHIKRKIKAMTELNGFKFDFEISTPEEVLLYEI